MKHVLHVLVALTMACGHSANYPRQDLSWMRHATVTVMRLSGYSNPDPRGLGDFHGLDVWEQHELDAFSRDEMVDFLSRVAAREDLAGAETQRTGQIGGGGWGCLSASRGIRFAVDGREYDFVVECDLWIQPAPGLRDRLGPQGTRFIFTKDEAQTWRTVFERHFKRGP